MTSRDIVLIVTANERTLDLWSEWLQEAGYATASCLGPRETRRCLPLVGVPCPLRDSADLALVEVPREPESQTEGWPERGCLTAPDDGRTLFVRDDSPRYEGSWISADR